jgi:hypothetical protein
VSTDIRGWIDFRYTSDDEDWISLAVLWPFLGAHDIYGCLFGVHNYARFAPPAAARGLPADATGIERSGWEADRATAGVEAYGATWVLADELAAIDWDELAEGPDERVHHYRRDADGALGYVTKSKWVPELDVLAESVDLVYRGYPDGTEWAIGEHIYRIETARRRDSLDTFVELGLRITADLAAQFGGGNVRWVAWFAD